MTQQTSLAYRCEVCKAKPGQPCTNTIRPGEPLPGRVYHYARQYAMTDAQAVARPKGATV